MQPDKADRKYQARYAEPEAVVADAPAFQCAPPFGHVLTIPVASEGEGFLKNLALTPEGVRGPVLVILVLNARSDRPLWQEENARLLERLSAEYPVIDHLGDVRWLRHPTGTVCVMDRSAPAHCFGPRDGVGRARKIAGDIAHRLVMAGRVRSPWIHFTDADARLPADYFARVPAADSGPLPTALVYPFRHEGAAAQIYEAKLQYYVDGLRWAGSPYAFHTVGSTMVVSARAYAQARGVPKRQAGEDFYLLNKLRKLGPVRTLSGAPIGLSGRASDRVPFGTGPAVRRIEAEGRPLLYHPESFARLRRHLEGLPSPGPVLDPAHRRFDALATLRFIHAQRSQGCPDLSWSTARAAGEGRGHGPPAGDGSRNFWGGPPITAA